MRFLILDNDKVAVGRPKDAGAAVAMAVAAVGTKADLSGVLADQEHTFAGYLATDRKTLLDHKRKAIGSLIPGDSLLPAKAIVKK